MKLKKALVIDPEKRSVYEVKIDNSKSVLHQWYDLIGNGCTLVTSIFKEYHNGTENYLMGDDEILLRKDDIVGGFTIDVGQGRYFIVANKAIMAGTDFDGENDDCTFSVEDIEKRVNWLNKEEAINYAKSIVE